MLTRADLNAQLASPPSERSETPDHWGMSASVARRQNRTLKEPSVHVRDMRQGLAVCRDVNLNMKSTIALHRRLSLSHG